jgi:hypothetical protein
VPLSDGAHSITYTLTDAAGLESPESAPISFTVDTTAPVAPVIGGVSDNAGPVTGTIADGDTTDDTTPTLTGTGEPGSVITVYDNGTPIGTAIADGSGDWSFTPAAPLGEGPHELTSTATDAAGLEGPESAPISFTVDTTRSEERRVGKESM